MKIKNADKFDFEFAQEEYQTLKKSIRIIEEVIELMEEKGLNFIRTGYPDYYYDYSKEELEEIENKLDAISSAWIIGTKTESEN